LLANPLRLGKMLGGDESASDIYGVTPIADLDGVLARASKFPRVTCLMRTSGRDEDGFSNVLLYRKGT